MTEQATDKDWAAVGDFAASLRTKAIRDRLNEIGFNGAAGDVVVVARREVLCSRRPGCASDRPPGPAR